MDGRYERNTIVDSWRLGKNKVLINVWCPERTWNREVIDGLSPEKDFAVPSVHLEQAFLGVVNLGLGGSRYKILAYIHLGIGSTFHTIRTDIL